MVRPALRLIAVLSGVLIALPLLPGSAAGQPGGPAAAPAVAQQPGTDDPEQLAENALEQVEDLFSDTGSISTTSADEPTSDLTMALRDLALRQDDLSGDDRDRAAAYLARPTDNPHDVPPNLQDVSHYRADEEEPVCSEVVCVHYVLRANDRRNGVRDVDTGAQYGVAGNDIPDYVDLALAEMTSVHNAYVEAGYRPPLPDGKGAEDSEDPEDNDKPDVYLAQLGDQGLYGYCTSDDPDAGEWTDHIGVFGYCVLDNDYRRAEFPSNSPQGNLRVTAAHEYFHNIQFGYDIAEDAWFMEATATWAEDELYDNVNDNLNYLRHGPLVRKRIALDTFGGVFHYGTWIWFRYLTEKYDDATGRLPNLVREMWERADAAEGPDDYSLEAIRAVLADRGTSFADEFTGFVTANRRPPRHYEEARENNYPHARLVDRVGLNRKRRNFHRFQARLNHLTSASYRFRPAKNLRGGWNLRLRFDLQNRRRGAAATYTVKRAGKPPVTTTVNLKPNGNRIVGRIPFTRGKTKWVEVTLVNTSIRYRCDVGAGWQHTCGGRALDDRRPVLIRGTAIKR